MHITGWLLGPILPWLMAIAVLPFLSAHPNGGTRLPR